MAAKTMKDVEQQDSVQRLRESLDYSYGQQAEKSNKAYDKAFSQAGNAMLKRGMQRSSYGAQIQSGLLDEKVKEENRIGEAKIADFQNRLNTLEQQEKEDERWERQFAAGRDDAEWQRGFSEKQFGANREDAEWNKNFQQNQADIGNSQWEKTFGANQAQNAIENAFREKQFNAQQEQQTIANQQWEQQFNAQQAQWREQFNYNALSDVQKSAFNVVAQAAALGNDVDDYLLGRAGLTRADFNSMKQQENFNKGAGSGNPAPAKTPDWKTAGFDSETTYKAAQAIGAKTPSEYLVALATRPRTEGATPYNPKLPELSEEYKKKQWKKDATDILKNRAFG